MIQTVEGTNAALSDHVETIGNTSDEKNNGSGAMVSQLQGHWTNTTRPAAGLLDKFEIRGRDVVTQDGCCVQLDISSTGHMYLASSLLVFLEDRLIRVLRTGRWDAYERDDDVLGNFPSSRTRTTDLQSLRSDSQPMPVPRARVIGDRGAAQGSTDLPDARYSFTSSGS